MEDMFSNPVIHEHFKTMTVFIFNSDSFILDSEISSYLLPIQENIHNRKIRKFAKNAERFENYNIIKEVVEGND
jgi:hypothetical protein